MDQGAVELIQDTAVKAEQPQKLETDRPSLFYKGQILDLEKLQLNRYRFRGAFKTSSLQDFMAYVAARVSGQGFIDVDSMSAKVFFNLMQGTPDAPQTAGHADHYGLLLLKRNAAYAAMCDALKVKLSQKAMVEFIEDWSDCLQADFEGVTAPESDPNLLTRAIAAVRKVKVKATGEATHTEGNFNASRTAMEEIEASSAEGLPQGFRFTCTPYDGLNIYKFYLRVSVLTSDEKPTFALRWRARETQIEQIGQDFKAKLLKGIGDKATMLLGSFDPGQ